MLDPPLGPSSPKQLPAFLRHLKWGGGERWERGEGEGEGCLLRKRYLFPTWD
jgi:hypothetical protein